MIYIDDFLTRSYWDDKPLEQRGLGVNIPKDYETMTVAEELETIQVVYAMGVPIMMFMVGFVLDMTDRADVQDAILWLRERNIPIAGHGYYHTAPEHLDGYAPWAEKTMAALKRIGQPPPYMWRFPRHESVNEDYIQGVGFELASYDYYLDPELNTKRSLEVLRGHEHHNAWVHSVYLTKVRLGQ